MKLVVMAAGMGSRFGGLKQLTPVGPNGEFLIDYSIYDAMKAGVREVVFVIRREMEQMFLETIGKRLKQWIPVTYVFQELSDIPISVTIRQFFESVQSRKLLWNGWLFFGEYVEQIW